MTARLVLHVGDCKTGSTSIQQALIAVERSGRSIWYGTGGDHNALAYACFDPIDPVPIAAYAAQAAQRTESCHVISAEMLEFADPDTVKRSLAKVIADRDITVIAYIRPHVSKLLSAFAETVKKGEYLGTLDSYARRAKTRDMLAYSPRIAAWRRSFGSAFRIRPYVPARLAGQDVVLDFFQTAALGLPPKPPEGKSRLNRSLCLEDLVMMQHVARRWLGYRNAATPSAEQMLLGRRFAALLADSPRQTSTRLALHETLLADVQAWCTADAKALDEEFGGHDFAQALETAHSVPQPQSFEIRDSFAPDVVRLIDSWSDLAYCWIESAPESVASGLRRLSTDPL